MLKRLWQDVRGVTMLEYALVASLVSIVGLAALTKVGTNLSTVFEIIANGM